MNEVEQAYEERIAHLRTGLTMALEDINLLKRMLGLPPTTRHPIVVLLEQDVERSLEVDKLRAKRT